VGIPTPLMIYNGVEGGVNVLNVDSYVLLLCCDITLSRIKGDLLSAGVGASWKTAKSIHWYVKAIRVMGGLSKQYLGK